MSTTFTTKILDLGVPTITGKIYKNDVVQAALGNYSSLGCFVLFGLPNHGMAPEPIELNNICAIATGMWIENDVLKARIKTLKNHGGIYLELSNQRFNNYGLNGYGTYEADCRTIKNFSLTSISLLQPQISHEQQVKDLLFN